MLGALYEIMFVVERSAMGPEIWSRLIGLPDLRILDARVGAKMSECLLRLVRARMRDMVSSVLGVLAIMICLSQDSALCAGSISTRGLRRPM